eukprot:3809429-Prorocentrum_lima.AAC.1
MFHDDEEPLDDNDLIQDQASIPTLDEADRYSRFGPNQGGGKGVHAAGLPSDERHKMENQRKRQSR